MHDQGDTVVYLAQAASPHAIRHSPWIGQVVPLQGAAIGAALRDAVRLDGLRHHPPDGRAGHERGRRAGGRAAGSVAAFNIVGPMFRLDDDTLASTGVPTLSMPGPCRRNCAA